MPRLACPEEAHATLHVVQRARERRACFSRTRDRATYLEALRECAARAECAVHAYALMGNHVHLLFTAARTAGAARLMPAIAACYARHLATAYDHEDSVWEEAYDASPVQARRHLLACMRYIEENPVRAGLAALFEFLASEPAYAHLALIDALTASPKAAAVAHDAMNAYAAMLEPGLQFSVNGGPPTAVSVEATAGALFELCFVYVATERTRELPSSAEAAGDIALRPFLGVSVP